MPKDRRYGIFNLDIFIVENNLELVSQAFAAIQFVPFWAEMHYVGEYIKYEGFSPKFRELSVGESLPKYEVVISKNNFGEINVSVKEIKK